MANLRDIAERAGVSRMTVSLALRGDPKVSKQVQERVRRIAKEIGYKPNPKVSRAMAELARSRHVEARERLAFLTTDPTENGWRKWKHNAGCFEGARLRALEYGYVLEPFWLRKPGMGHEKTADMLWNRGIEGVMVAPLGNDMEIDGIRTFDFDWSRFSVVELSETLDEPRFDCARHDHFDGMLQALFSLEKMGYRRIGLTIERILDVRTRHRWYSAYLLWRSVRGYATELPVLFYENPDIEQTAKWIETNGMDAVVTARNELFGELDAHGIRVPEQLGLAVLDRPVDDEQGLSGISQQAVMIGSAAADLLVGLVHRGEKGIPELPSQKICTGRWNAGATTRKVGKPLDESSLFDRMLPA